MAQIFIDLLCRALYYIIAWLSYCLMLRSVCNFTMRYIVLIVSFEFIVKTGSKTLLCNILMSLFIDIKVQHIWSEQHPEHKNAFVILMLPIFCIFDIIGVEWVLSF